MALKELGIRKCVSSGLASQMFTIRCISIIFCCSLFMCYHWISLGIYSYISAWVSYVASELNSYIYVRQQVFGFGSGFLIRQLLTIQSSVLAIPKLAAPARSDNLLLDGTLYISYAFQIVRRARPKWCSKSTIAFFLSNTDLFSSIYSYIFFRTKL